MTNATEVGVEWLESGMSGDYLTAEAGGETYQFTIDPRTGEVVQEQDRHLEDAGVTIDEAPDAVEEAVIEHVDDE